MPITNEEFQRRVDYVKASFGHDINPLAAHPFALAIVLDDMGAGYEDRAKAELSEAVRLEAIEPQGRRALKH